MGLRLALAARALVYGEKIEYSGPLFRHAIREGESMRVYFDHASGLTSRGRPPQGFELAGTDRRFHAAVDRVEDDTLIVTSGAVRQPVNVRYAWSDTPIASLFNAAGLPASPFTSHN